MKKSLVSSRNWATIIIFGLIGQIAWSIENMEFNLFLFNYVGGSTQDIATMVAWSAIISTLATLIMGIISDSLGHRKTFLCLGYILWGISTLAFAFISRENTAKLFPQFSISQVLMFTTSLVIVMDCVMSFFGSIANDASFNSWVTESTDNTNRATVEGVLNTFPLLSMLIVAGAAGIIINATGWPNFFIYVGIIVIICGILGFFFVKEPKKTLPVEKLGFFQSIIYGFKPSVIKENAKFYLTLLGLCIFNIATQIFMPYLLIYLEKTLQFSTTTYSIVMAIVIFIASIMSIVIGRLIDTFGKRLIGNLSIMVFAIGLFVISLVTSSWAFILVGSIMMTGYVSISIVFMSSARDYTPAGHVGMFQGIRLLAYVLIPMIIGPNIGSLIINSSHAGTYLNSYNEVVSLPVSGIFIAAGIVAIIVLLPFNLLLKKEKN